MKYTILVAPLLVAACAQQPTIVHEPVEVKVPVPVPCVRKEDIPTCPPSKLDSVDLRGRSMYEKTQAALQDLEQDRSCNRELQAILLRCTETTK